MRVSQFNVFTPSLFEGTTLLYNTLTGSFLSLGEEQLEQALTLLGRVAENVDPAELAHDELAQTLAKAGFIVRDDVDERAVVRERYWRKDEPSNRSISLTIAPTVSCNLSCTYCFQEHPPRRMSDENIAAIKEYVADRLSAASGLYIMWFGGEPLLGFDVIRELNEYFTEACAEAGVPYKQSMVSNGMLLKGERLEYFCRQGNVSYIQITLDGPPRVHDTRRLQMNGKPTFRKILDNIKEAAGRVRISLRVNVDKTNGHLLDELIEILGNEGLRDRVSPYLGHVLPYTSTCQEVDQVAYTKEEFAELETSFKLALFENGFRPSVSLPRPRFGNFCVADHPNGALFSPGELVFRCWNETTGTPEQASGHLEGGEVEASEAQSRNRDLWSSYDPHSHAECQECLVQPL
ncbi:MAG: radical SAM protein, partial [Planctomycetota bacterium]